MNLHVVAYPVLDKADYNVIQKCREQYNSLFKVIEPHFTIVFSVADAEATDFIAEIRKQATGTRPISFCIRCAVINKDAISGNYDAFLVPDEGHSRVIKLHDRLYSGLLEPHCRLDIPYIPHMSIANSPDAQVIKQIVDQWNNEPFVISGRIDTLDIINYENRVVTTIEKISLAPAG